MPKYSLVFSVYSHTANGTSIKFLLPVEASDDEYLQRLRTETDGFESEPRKPKNRKAGKPDLQASNRLSQQWSTARTEDLYSVPGNVAPAQGILALLPVKRRQSVLRTSLPPVRKCCPP